MPFPEGLEWNQPGVEPSQAKKNEGWKPEEKPPAEYFNWFFNRMCQAVGFLSDKTSNLTASDIGNDPVGNLSSDDVQSTLESLYKLASSRGINRNLVLFGPLSAQGAAAYLEGVGSNQITLKANTLLSFAAGMSDLGPLEHIEKVPADINLALAAAGLSTVPLAYTDDLCNGGTAISSGDYTGGAAVQAFDGLVNLSWLSSHQAANQLGVAYIGYDFGIARAIRRIFFQQNTLAANSVTSVRVQYSTNNTAWNDALTINNVSTTLNYANIPPIASARYWRILANSNVTNGASWAVLEVEMYEALQTHYIYTDRNKSTGAITLGSTKQKPRIAATSDTYTDNLCVGGAVIASGSYDAASAKENAYDGNTNSSWASEVGTAFTARYNGYDFGVSRSIRRVAFYVSQTFPTSAKIRKSTDGAAWTDVQTVAVVAGWNIIDLPTGSSARFWQIIGNSTTRLDGITATTNSIFITEITMHEIATELLWYEPTEGKSRWYDGSAWVEVERIPLGSVNVDSAGKVVSMSLNDYGLIPLARFSDIRVPNAVLTDQPVTLGQFPAALSGAGWCKLPSGVIFQWTNVILASANTGYTVTFPITFPLACRAVSAIGNQAAAVWLNGFSNTSALVASNVGSNSVYLIAVGY